jgi:hypothetical protein
VAASGRYLFALAGELRDTFARQEGVDKDRVRLFPGSSKPLNRAAVVWTSPTAGLVVADPTFEPPLAGQPAGGSQHLGADVFGRLRPSGARSTTDLELVRTGGI